MGIICVTPSLSSITFISNISQNLWARWLQILVRCHRQCWYPQNIHRMCIILVYIPSPLPFLLRRCRVVPIFLYTNKADIKLNSSKFVWGVTNNSGHHQKRVYKMCIILVWFPSSQSLFREYGWLGIRFFIIIVDFQSWIAPNLYGMSSTMHVEIITKGFIFV